MEISTAGPWVGIKAKTPRNVKAGSRAGLRAILVFLGLFTLTLPGEAVRADTSKKAAKGAKAEAPAPDPAPPAADSTPPPPAPAPPAEHGDPDALPDIDAKDYGVKVVRRSLSGRVYLFNDLSGAEPRTGRILLLKRESDNVMALRILKNYPDKKQFAAKRVRRYGDIHSLEGGETFRAVEKISDLAAGPPTAQDKADLKELEKEKAIDSPAGSEGEKAAPAKPSGDTLPYDPELDAGTSPPPAGAIDSEDSKAHPSEALELEDDDELGHTVEEVFPIDVNTHWLSAEFGFFRNSGATAGSSSYFAGGGIRYALTLGRLLFIRKATVQDSLALEAGVFTYKILNFAASNDSYNVVPLVGTVRYNILLGESFGIFLYGGIVKNKVTGTSQSSDDIIGLLSADIPAAGGGLLFRVGPNWDARVDFGIDMIAMGLMLRF